MLHRKIRIRWSWRWRSYSCVSRYGSERKSVWKSTRSQGFHFIVVFRRSKTLQIVLHKTLSTLGCQILNTYSRVSSLPRVLENKGTWPLVSREKGLYWGLIWGNTRYLYYWRELWLNLIRGREKVFIEWEQGGKVRDIFKGSREHTDPQS